MDQFVALVRNCGSSNGLGIHVAHHQREDVCFPLQNKFAITPGVRDSNPSRVKLDFDSNLSSGRKGSPRIMDSCDAKSSTKAASAKPDGVDHDLVGFQKRKPLQVSVREERPLDFWRIVCEGVVAGGTAGVVVEAALYPIDTIKTRLQAAHGGGKIILKGLYSGLAGNLAGVLLASAIFIGVYEPEKQKLLRTFPENLSALAHLTAGAVGGLASSLVVKQRMQTLEFASAPSTVCLIIAREGFKGLYAGYGSFLLRDLPFDAIQFCIYEQLRIGYRIVARRELRDHENAMIGAFAGAITGAMTTPLDVIKTRLMIQGATKQYRGISHCVKNIIQEEGPAALMKVMQII
ncbi:hypothetical protein BT93_F1993 [Corymbia citriodora subsp. variegata]|nr:hypothetical protein BT93_F1993 [Corymbia citriodora subsp. variegata]